MASAERVKAEVPPPPPDKIVLTLTEREANTLRAFLYQRVLCNARNDATVDMMNISNALGRVVGYPSLIGRVKLDSGVVDLSGVQLGLTDSP